MVHKLIIFQIHRALWKITAIKQLFDLQTYLGQDSNQSKIQPFALKHCMVFPFKKEIIQQTRRIATSLQELQTNILSMKEIKNVIVAI